MFTKRNTIIVYVAADVFWWLWFRDHVLRPYIGVDIKGDPMRRLFTRMKVYYEAL